MRNSSENGTLDLVERFMEWLRTVVPLGTLNQQEYVAGIDGSWDAMIHWRVGRASLTMAIDVKLDTGVIAPPRRVRERGVVEVLIAPFLPRSTRKTLDEGGWSYWDATGNALIRSDSPPLFVRLDGADRNPDPEPTSSTALRSLKGRAASEVIVGLLQNGGQTGTLRDFAQQRQLPLGTVSRVVSLLRDENFIEPTGGGPIVLTDRMEVARRWAEDYSFIKSFRARRYYSLSGPELALTKIAKSGVRYAITGVRAAQSWMRQESEMSRLPATETWLYVEDLAAVQRIADLAVDTREGQIVIAESSFLSREHTRVDEDRAYATPWRVVGDLLSAGGRIGSVGEQVANDLVRRWP